MHSKGSKNSKTDTERGERERERKEKKVGREREREKQRKEGRMGDLIVSLDGLGLRRKHSGTDLPNAY